MSQLPPLSTRCMALRELARGQSAVIADLCGAECLCERLAAMGFAVGTTVRMITAPGDSCAVQVGESRVVLRGHPLEAVRVSVS